MIKKQVSTYSFIVLTMVSLINHKAFAFITSVSLQKNDQRKICLIGESYHPQYKKSDPWADSEERDKQLLLSTVDHLRKNGAKVHFLMELSERDIARAKAFDVSAVDKNCGFGLLPALGVLAARYNSQYGSIQFKWVDQRGDVSSNLATVFSLFSNPTFARTFPGRFLQHFDGRIKMEAANNYQLRDALDQWPNGRSTNNFDRILEACSPSLRNKFFEKIFFPIFSQFKQNSSQFTVNDFFTEIDKNIQWLERMKKKHSENNRIRTLLEKYICQITEGRSLANSFFSSMKTDKTVSCADVVFLAAHKRSFAFVKDLMYQWYFPMTNVVADAGIIDSVLSSFEECDNVIFVGGNNHAVELRELLVSCGLFSDFAQGDLSKDGPGDPVPIQSNFSNCELKTLLQQMSDAFSSDKAKTEKTELRLACSTCGKTEGKLLRCGKCKQVWYCSKSCQKADWSDHKYFCLKK